MENDIEETIKARTEQLATFRDLGPPDLVQYHRTNGSKEVYSSYASSSCRLERIIMLLESIALRLLH